MPPGRSVVPSHPFPRRFQHIHPIDPVVQHIKPELRFLLGLLAQFLSQLRNLLRQSWLLHRFRSRLSRGCPSLRSGIFIQAVFSSSYRFMFSVKPLCSTGVIPFPRYYGPLRLATAPLRRLCLPNERGPLSLASLPCLPASPTVLSTRACPNHPGWSPGCFSLLLHHRALFSSQ